MHIAYLVEFDNKLLVLIQWAWNYFTRKRGARLITGDSPYPLMQSTASDQRQTLVTLPFFAEVEAEW